MRMQRLALGAITWLAAAGLLWACGGDKEFDGERVGSVQQAALGDSCHPYLYPCSSPYKCCNNGGEYKCARCCNNNDCGYPAGRCASNCQDRVEWWDNQCCGIFYPWTCDGLCFSSFGDCFNWCEIQEE